MQPDNHNGLTVLDSTLCAAGFRQLCQIFDWKFGWLFLFYMLNIKMSITIFNNRDLLISFWIVPKCSFIYSKKYGVNLEIGQSFHRMATSFFPKCLNFKSADSAQTLPGTLFDEDTVAHLTGDIELIQGESFGITQRKRMVACTKTCTNESQKANT